MLRVKLVSHHLELISLFSRLRVSVVAGMALCASILFAQTDQIESESVNERPYAVTPHLEEELVVTGERLTLTSPRTMLETYDANARGGYFYKLRNYERAYPYLLEAAKMGFKESQARVGFIYQQGLGGVERNWVEAVGWIGVAASRESRPEIKNYFRRMRKSIEAVYPAHMEKIDEIVETYISKYGSKATGVNCDMNRPAGSHIAKMSCRFKDEERYRDELGLYDVAAPEAIGGGAPGGF